MFRVSWLEQLSFDIAAIAVYRDVPCCWKGGPVEITLPETSIFASENRCLEDVFPFWDSRFREWSCGGVRHLSGIRWWGAWRGSLQQAILKGCRPCAPRLSQEEHAHHHNNRKILKNPISILGKYQQEVPPFSWVSYYTWGIVPDMFKMQEICVKHRVSWDHAIRNLFLHTGTNMKSVFFYVKPGLHLNSLLTLQPTSWLCSDPMGSMQQKIQEWPYRRENAQSNSLCHSKIYTEDL